MSGHIPAEEALRKNLRGAEHTKTDARQAWLNKQIGSEWLDIEKHIAWHGGYRLDRLIVSRNDDGWLLMVKAHRNGRPYVSFLQGGTVAEAFELGGEFSARGVLTWQADEWPSKWLKRRLGMK